LEGEERTAAEEIVRDEIPTAVWMSVEDTRNSEGNTYYYEVKDAREPLTHAVDAIADQAGVLWGAPVIAFKMIFGKEVVVPRTSYAKGGAKQLRVNTLAFTNEDGKTCSLKVAMKAAEEAGEQLFMTLKLQAVEERPNPRTRFPAAEATPNGKNTNANSPVTNTRKHRDSDLGMSSLNVDEGSPSKRGKPDGRNLLTEEEPMDMTEDPMF